jgi:hypothetical protein
MKYSEMIEKYLKGELPENEAGEVERDIEKHEAISDYLAEREDIPELGKLLKGDEKKETHADEGAADFTKRIKKQIRRAFLKAGLITGLLILGIVFFCMYALPKIIERSYYDPTETVGYVRDENGELQTNAKTDRLSLDLSVYSELFLPGKLRQSASANSLGYGNYSVCIHQNFSSTGVFRDTAGVIRRGKLTLYDPNILNLPVMNCFDTVKAGLQGIRVSFEGIDVTAETLTGGMQAGDTRMAYVTFGAPMSYDELVAWCEENDVYPEWGAVCTGGEIKTPVFYGVRLSLNSVFQGFDEQKYPHLSLYSLGRERQDGESFVSEELMKEHLVSLLNYCADNPDGMKLFYSAGELNVLLDGCRASADYIRENGFSIYGVAFYATAEKIEEVFSLESVVYMHAENAE